MNCKEFKDLVSEIADLNEISSNAELSAHLKGCEGCRRFLKYEEALRDSFAEIAEAPMPADIARRILATPRIAGTSEQSGNMPAWLKWLSGLISSFSFKVALASGITGFLFAVLLLRGPIREFGGRIQESFARSEQKEQIRKTLFSQTHPLPQNASGPVIYGIGAAITMDPELQKLIKANKSHGGVSGLPEFFKKHEMAQADKQKAIKEAREQGTPREEIPGAVSFALEGEEIAMHNQETSEKSQFARPLEQTNFPAGGDAFADSEIEAETDTKTDSSVEAVLAAATADKDEEKTMTMAMAPSAPSIRAKSMPDSSKSLQLEEESKEAGIGSLANDLRASEILKFLQNNELAGKEGFVDLEYLAMRGFISNQQLRAWQPADGNSWYLAISDGKSRLSLRRKP